MTWDEFIQIELQKPYFQHLVEFLKVEDKTKTILPPREKRMTAFRLTPFDEVKVVIVGQDPYHNYNQAHGLAFSVEEGAYPPSLRNIYKELVSDLGISYPKTGNLSKWAKQGVLLLNTSLTVEVHRALSHKGIGWETFTLEAIKKINEKELPVVFILWGSHAQSFEPYINHKRHYIIKSPHPSPLSATRGFFGSKPFSKTNQFLKSHQMGEIDWSL
ncbi:MAG: uracil-DNA glycosylase [Bacillota bacterium]|nr:MAG: uracil-DNA glycosylase [Bacillota bacterium]